LTRLHATPRDLPVGHPPFLGETPVETYHLTMRGKYRLPVRFPRAAKSLISKLLMHHPSLRLGCMKGGRDVQAHDWFTTGGVDPSIGPISWTELEKRILAMPFVPSVRGAVDTSYFDDYDDMADESNQWAGFIDASYDETWQAEFGSGVRC